ncbi:MAG: hypothetical protein U5K37_08635 [Natrialbaceae archaeon]|nr:hypothetical protein [Natrialbaceae archaeon]
MTTLTELFHKGLSNPNQILPYLKQKSGIQPWGWRGPAIKMAELKYRTTNYQYQTTSIWDKDWDLLVILDACRPEWVKTVEDDYEYIDNVDTIHSVGSHSKEWILNTFDDRYSSEMKETIYITGNHYGDLINESKLAAFESAQDYGEWAYDSASPPANVVTDLAVNASRNSDWERCIVHYMQPHKPFISKTSSRDDISVQDWSIAYKPYRMVFDGRISKDELIEGFISNLQYVLDEVTILLENIEAPTAILT